MAKGLKVALALGAVALLTATAAFAASDRGTASDTLVYGASADPSLVGSVAQRRTASHCGRPARSSKAWSASRRARAPSCRRSRPSGPPARTSLAWTFKLRKGVQFSDGTPFNAAAVCANFTRWYSFPAPLQSDALELLLADGLRRIRQAGTGRSRAGQEPLQGLQGARPVLRVDPAQATVVLVPRGDRLAELRDREPDGAQEVRGGCGHRRRDRRLPSDGHVRDAASDRHRPLHAPVVDAGQQAGARRQPEVLGAEAEDQADHLHPDR